MSTRVHLLVAAMLLTVGPSASESGAEERRARPCSGQSTSGLGAATSPPLGEVVAAQKLAKRTRPFHVEGDEDLPWKMRPRSVENIICRCAVCESDWFDGRYVAGATTGAGPGAEQVATVRCGEATTQRGYLVGGLAGKELVTVEDTAPGAVVHWLDLPALRASHLLRAGLANPFLSGGQLVSNEGDGVVIGGKAWFANKTGALRAYPSKQDLDLPPLRQIYSRDEGRKLVEVACTGYRGQQTLAGFVYGLTKVVDEPEPEVTEVRLARVWASERWIVRSFVPSPTIWMSSHADGSQSELLAYGGLRECGQPLMNDHVLTIEESRAGASVLALSLLSAEPDYRLSAVPLEGLYCVAGDGGLIAVTGRWQGRPAIAIYSDGAWQRLELPESRSVLEPLVRGDRIFVSAPEEAAVAKEADAPVPSVGAVYVLTKHGGVWAARTKIVPARARRHALFGYRVVPVGDRLFINYLDAYPRGPGMPRSGFGYPSFCDVPVP